MLLKTVIFLSGAAILALELLASRIMTPYFGVSLYIWTGILSITLVSLAIGYWGGGRVAEMAGKAKSPVTWLTQVFALMPALAAWAIVAACLIYPFAFAPLANWSLIGGAFTACLLLLLLPLVVTSAMNPLLVAIASRESRRADAGSGFVFFVSTVGSVAGVLVTAFVLIPYMTNYGAVLVVGIVLALLTIAVAISPPVPMPARTAVGAVGITAALAAGGLLAMADSYTGRTATVAYGGVQWHVEASMGSLFGTVKILRSAPDPDTGLYSRIYFHDGLTQNTVDSQGRSTSFYTYALDGLSRAYRPAMKSVLVLGLGAGMVPMTLADAGASVTVVDIDPNASLAASRYFGFDPSKVSVKETDARTYVRQCDQRYDVAVVDLFHGDGTPEYLITREFFRDLKRCLADGGVAVFNTFADLENTRTYAHFLATLRSELPALQIYRPQWEHTTHINSFVVASALPLPGPAKITFDYVPARHEKDLWNMLAAPTIMTPKLFEGGEIITDARNGAARDLAMEQMVYRKGVVEYMPPQFLLN
jgi:spermidine synthase